MANKFRQNDKGSYRRTASYFPHAWIFQSTVYGGYRWGIFYDNRLKGYSLTKNWQAALERVKEKPWADFEEYKLWRDRQPTDNAGYQREISV